MLETVSYFSHPSRFIFFTSEQYSFISIITDGLIHQIVLRFLRILTSYQALMWSIIK